MRKSAETTIEGRRWTLIQHGGIEGHRLLTGLMRLGGAAIEALAATGAAKNAMKADDLMEVEIGLDAFAALSKNLLGNLDDDDILKVVMEIVKHCKCDGEPVGGEAFDDFFAGEYVLLYRVVGWSLKENFAKAFQSSGIGDLFAAVPGAVKAAMGQTSPTRSGSTTQDG